MKKSKGSVTVSGLAGVRKEFGKLIVRQISLGTTTYPEGGNLNLHHLSSFSGTTWWECQPD